MNEVPDLRTQKKNQFWIRQRKLRDSYLGTYLLLCDCLNVDEFKLKNWIRSTALPVLQQTTEDVSDDSDRDFALDTLYLDEVERYSIAIEKQIRRLIGRLALILTSKRPERRLM
jgi:hypothetical protein